ncbi:hypothetical protein C0992_011508 [Termitomyces sp. T32_za158]|nr:hypothetical protein C0992_011508 [Termitomyces sp. T32_za158]
MGRVFMLKMNQSDFMFSCPLNQCDFRGEIRDLYKHFESIHYQKHNAPLDPLPFANSPMYLNELPIHDRKSGCLHSFATPASSAFITPPLTDSSIRKRKPSDSYDFAQSAHASTARFASTSKSASVSPLVSYPKKLRLDSDPFLQGSPSSPISALTSPTLIQLPALESRLNFPPSSSPDPTSSSNLPTIPLAVLGEHSVFHEFLKFFASRVNLIENTCVAHMVLQIPVIDPHSDLIKCSIPVRTGAGHYEDSFRRGLCTDDNIRACYSCWCPQPLVQYHHDKNVGRNCANEWHQDFWRGLAYIVWRCDALFPLVMEFLNIPSDQLADLYYYKQWLLKRGPFPNNMFVSNLVMVVYAYFRLHDLNRLPKGELQLRGELFVDFIATTSLIFLFRC